MADALDSGSSGSDTVWVQVPSTAGVIEKAGHKTCLFYYVAEPNLNPRVQGLLDMNVSSVGSTGKRFAEPFSDSVSPHQVQEGLPLMSSRSPESDRRRKADVHRTSCAPSTAFRRFFVFG